MESDLPPEVKIRRGGFNSPSAVRLMEIRDLVALPRALLSKGETKRSLLTILEILAILVEVRPLALLPFAGVARLIVGDADRVRDSDSYA